MIVLKYNAVQKFRVSIIVLVKKKNNDKAHLLRPIRTALTDADQHGQSLFSHIPRANRRQFNMFRWRNKCQPMSNRLQQG